MKALRVIMSFDELDGFSSDCMAAKISKSLAEVGLSLLKYEYKKDAKDICPDYPELNRKLSVCGFLVEYKEFPAPIPYEPIALGCFSDLEREYPYFKNFSTTPDLVDI